MFCNDDSKECVADCKIIDVKSRNFYLFYNDENISEFQHPFDDNLFDFICLYVATINAIDLGCNLMHSWIMCHLNTIQEWHCNSIQVYRATAQSLFTSREIFGVSPTR